MMTPCAQAAETGQFVSGKTVGSRLSMSCYVAYKSSSTLLTDDWDQGYDGLCHVLMELQRHLPLPGSHTGLTLFGVPLLKSDREKAVRIILKQWTNNADIGSAISRILEYNERVATPRRTNSV